MNATLFQLVALAAAVGVLVALLLLPNESKRLLGMALGFVARVVHRFDRRAVALRVEGEINSAREALLQDAPEVVTGSLKLEFARAREAVAAAQAGEVVVVMRKSSRHEENVAHALMTYLPRAVVPVARPYLATETVRAVDFTIARAILGSNQMQSAREYLTERLVEPARKGSTRLADQLTAMDAIDLHGWLTRVLLVEFKRIGDLMYPGAQDERLTLEADDFTRWLHELAKPGSVGSLQYKGRFFKVAVVLVAMSGKLALHGLHPYRSRVIGLLYHDYFSIVHLMGRDNNISSVRALAQTLESQGLIAAPSVYEYDLRADFAAKRFDRKRAICISVRRNPERVVTEEDDTTLPSATFVPPTPSSAPIGPALFPFQVEQGAICELEKTRGFGFIATSDGARIFFHSSQLTDCALKDLRIGQRVIYRKIFDSRRNKHHAETVKPLPDVEIAGTKGTRTK